MTLTRIVKLAPLAVTLLLVSCSVQADDDESQLPDVPQLDISVDDDGATIVSRHGDTDALDADALLELLDTHAGFRDEGTWHGRDAATGISENPVVMHADAMSDAREIGKLYEGMASRQLYRSAIGITEHIDDPLLPPNAPDLDDLPEGYLKIELPKDEGLSSTPSVPKEQITLYPRWAEDDGGSFVVAIDARSRKAVEESSITRRELESKDAGRRDEVIEKIKEATSDYIAKSGARIEICEIVFDRGEDSEATPWALVDMAYRAVLKLNAEREKAGKDALDIRMAWETQIAEPPPPEQPPKVKVEYPKDEPEEVDPTEDERIVPDAKDKPKEEDKGAPDEGDWDDADEASTPRTTGGLAWRLEQKLEHAERVNAALQWLIDHQNIDGCWDATGFDDDTTRDGAELTRNLEFVKVGQPEGDQGWEASTRVALTGLSLLAFTAGGHTHIKGKHRAAIRSAILYLRKLQDNDGCFGDKADDHFVYNHAMATAAIAELYGLSGDGVLKPVADKGVEFILKAQNPGLGWRYGVQPGINDSSVTGWMVYTLCLAKKVGLEFDSSKSFDDASEWYKMVTVNVNGYPKCGYDSPGSNNARLRSAGEYDNNPTMDAIYVFSMLAMGEADLQDSTIKQLGGVLTDTGYLPKWEHTKIDFYYWYWAGLATWQVGGKRWETWDTVASKTLKDHQRGWHETDIENAHTSPESLDEHGSWDPVGAWGSAGGRVYSTAMGALILQTSNRYQRFHEE